ncbi:charged multivesicular body protein 2a [Nephila pilipes]|uniref:Charged multivesicular body protein 2a n=2 Tax=Nephilidae TaxID=450948 RepID=A0A8X6TDA5_NEPPI|nr:charged multivesicular body protein 2a [Nephila pilipes]
MHKLFSKGIEISINVPLIEVSIIQRCPQQENYLTGNLEYVPAKLFCLMPEIQLKLHTIMINMYNNQRKNIYLAVTVLKYFCNRRMALEFLFGRRKTPEEMLRQNQRALNKAMRDLDRERSKMEQQEKKIINDIKKMAKENQMDAVKIMAKDLVRTRRYVKKFILMRANIQAVSLKIQTLRSQNAMAQAMKGVTRAMQNMNKQLNLPQIQKIMQEFEKQSEIMEMKEEMINDTIDDAMGDDEDEEESDAIVAQVLDELGLDVSDKLKELPSTGGTLSTGVSTNKQPALADVDADLQARLENLRRE